MHKLNFDECPTDPVEMRQWIKDKVIEGFIAEIRPSFDHYHRVLDNIFLNGLDAQLDQSDLDILK